MSRCAGSRGGWIGWWKRIWIEVRITMYELGKSGGRCPRARELGGCLGSYLIPLSLISSFEKSYVAYAVWNMQARENTQTIQEASISTQFLFIVHVHQYFSGASAISK